MTIATSRDIEHAVVGGVCAGIASRYSYPVKHVRAATVALSVATVGIGGIAYLALWRNLPTSANDTVSTNGGSLPATDDATVANADAPPVPASVESELPSEIVPPSSAALPLSLESIYGPVASDLPLVRETIDSVTRGVGFDFLAKMLDQQLAGTGKMMRPALALLAGRLGTYDLEKVVPLAASVELLHTATLVHDDVIDEADERRGNDTANSLFGNSASVMLGDYMFANAAELITRTDNIKVVKNFAATLMMMVRGELNQDATIFEYSEDVQRYLDRITGKTASLFATCAEGGALVCGAPAEQVESMRIYGLRLGIAFQIVDDILDFTGDPVVMGKPAVGSDLRNGTLTLPAILYMQQEPDDNPIKRAFDGQRRRANLDRAISEILDGDFIAESMTTAQRFGTEAREALQALPPSNTRDTLDSLVDYVLDRNS
jgi:geranylgeranyl pyrophosphate synthase/phage shock protein PspC (stress-responsive transcriptional regulator)